VLTLRQNHRGQGLARAVVRKALEKVAERHAVEPRPCAPYVYVDRSNAASQRLFDSLGFEKCNEVVWAELRLKDV
jgi:ribosomal protein S18 acetylase RimI-like enzyme